MNCGNSDTNSIASFGFSTLVVAPIASSRSGCSFGNVFTSNGERPPGRTACQARYSR